MLFRPGDVRSFDLDTCMALLQFMGFSNEERHTLTQRAYELGQVAIPEGTEEFPLPEEIMCAATISEPDEGDDPCCDNISEEGDDFEVLIVWAGDWGTWTQVLGPRISVDDQPGMSGLETVGPVVTFSDSELEEVLNGGSTDLGEVD